MDRNEMKQFVTRVVMEKAELDEELDPNANLRDFNVDSLLMLEVVVALEKKFNVKVPEDRYVQMTTLENTVRVLEDAIAARG